MESGGKPNDRAFKRRVSNAVADESLRTALGRALPEFGRRRVAACSDQDFTLRRQRVRAIKAGAIEQLPELVDRFTREAEAVGAVVHRAETAEDARQVITEIATQHGARLAV